MEVVSWWSLAGLGRMQWGRYRQCDRVRRKPTASTFIFLQNNWNFTDRKFSYCRDNCSKEPCRDALSDHNAAAENIVYVNADSPIGRRLLSSKWKGYDECIRINAE